MDNLKDKMYNYEVMPPTGVWDDIAGELDKEQGIVIQLPKKRNKTLYYAIAASVAVLLLCIVFFTNRFSKQTNKEIVSSPLNSIDTAKQSEVIMTVPQEEKDNTVKNYNQLSTKNHTQKGGPNENSDTKKEDSSDNVTASNTNSNYITIESPQGQPVRVSSKMALLIDSSETKVFSKPIWHKKINEWREIMKGNTLAPTPGNFLDIVELTKSLKDNK